MWHDYLWTTLCVTLGRARCPLTVTWMPEVRLDVFHIDKDVYALQLGTECIRRGHPVRLRVT